MTSRPTVAVAVAVLLAACAGPGRRSDAFRTADSLRDAGRFVLAKPVYRALADSFAARHDTAGWWRADVWWAQMLLRTGQYDSAREVASLADRVAGTSPDGRGWVHYQRCAYWSRLGAPDSAVAQCDSALALADSAHDHELGAYTHQQLGTVWSRRGRYRRSVPETEIALQLERTYGRSPAHLAAILNNMGIEYANVGRLSEADSAYREGVAIARRIGNRWLTDYLASNQSDLHALTGDLEGATRLMAAALRDAEAVDDSSTMVYAHNGFAELYLRAKNWAAARAELRRSLQITAHVPVIFRVSALLDLGLVELGDGRLDTARVLLMRAQRVADSSEFGFERTRTRVGLSRIALRSGHAPDAVRWADAAVRIADSLGDPAALADALGARAEALEATKRGDATAGFLEGVALLESWRGRLAAGDLAVGVAEPHWGVYEGAVRTLMASGRAADAFDVAERARARTLLQLLATHDASRAAATQRGALEARLRERYQERGAAETPAERAVLDREVSALVDSLARAEAIARVRNPVAVPNVGPVSLATLRARLLGGGRGLFTVFWGDHAVYGWWITRDALRGARLGNSDSLAALVDFLQTQLREAGGDTTWRLAARAAYRRFVAPLAPGPRAHVIVVLDGPLAHIPVEALMPDDDTVPWGARTTFTYAPSVSVLAALADRRTDVVWRRAVLAVGNPEGATRDDGASDARGSDPESDRALPYAEQEARTVRDLFRDDGADLLLGRHATLARWLGLDPSRYRYLHFAAHALVSDRRPAETRLMLSGGALDLVAIGRLDLHAQLVTLSACETALGHRVRGEGVIGLPYAFLSAGAQAVVVSLWAVGDAPTAEFMADFYRELKRGAAPVDALAAVRRRYMRRYPPADWAPFVLVGGRS